MYVREHAWAGGYITTSGREDILVGECNTEEYINLYIGFPALYQWLFSLGFSPKPRLIPHDLSPHGSFQWRKQGGIQGVHEPPIQEILITMICKKVFGEW